MPLISSVCNNQGRQCRSPRQASMGRGSASCTSLVFSFSTTPVLANSYVTHPHDAYDAMHMQDFITPRNLILVQQVPQVKCPTTIMQGAVFKHDTKLILYFPTALQCPSTHFRSLKHTHSKIRCNSIIIIMFNTLFFGVPDVMTTLGGIYFRIKVSAKTVSRLSNSSSKLCLELFCTTG
jgi:hypothetical protein